ncbi:MAG: ATP-dependent DNA helicase PcrA, partial [Clostridia bacterium]|nr:ATP-dependent DNA helicase PcrA [Clostridia bacterium]
PFISATGGHLVRSSGDARNPAGTPKPKAEPLIIPKKPDVPVDSFNTGDSVSHATFGTGVVLSVKPMGNDALLEIAFDKAGTKKLMAKFAKLKKN